MDNCEHLVESAAQLVDVLLDSCSRLRVLATSREPLGVTGELVRFVPPLSAPDAQQCPAVEDLKGYESTRLFADHASNSHPHFELTPENAPPDAPQVFEGKERIAEYLRKTYLGEWSPRVGYSLNDVVEGDGRIALNVAYVDANGTQVLASENYGLSGGKIVEQLNIEAHRE